MSDKSIFVGDTILKNNLGEVKGEYVNIDGEKFYKISNYDLMLPFFISIVSDSDHWMFISSKGGLTAGRKNPGNALFPYVTDDKIHDSSYNTGNKTIVFIEYHGKTSLWEPFSDNYKGLYTIKRNIYKNVTGNKLIFEEINEDLAITFQYGWYNSDKYGFVKKSKIVSNGIRAVNINILDGIQNILPANVDPGMQTGYSTLVDAYKKNELLPESEIAIYSLSSVPVDKAEPSESLKASIGWSVGMEGSKKLISSQQLDKFRFTRKIEHELDSRALRGAYFVNSTFSITKNSEKEWYIIIDIDKDLTDIVDLQKHLSESKIGSEQIEIDIENGTRNLINIVANADGLQVTADELSSARHFSNVLFNVMRGGTFDNNYHVEKNDFIKYIKNANRAVASKNEYFLTDLPDIIEYSELIATASKMKDADLERLCYEYLPLTFSRRHGDPSRPWNVFSVETKTEDGSKILYYQGNWRDIFQNWEALAISFPGFIESMISKFVNASTADGYNPYRITRDGFDWEVQDINDPWSNIGYWGDHQIIYLLKLLELSNKYHPGNLNEFLSKELFSFANVPYRIKSYEELLKNPHDTIIFDKEINELVNHRVKSIGSDGKLLWSKDDKNYLVNLSEKMFISILAKFSNFIPGAGIWMNTQRPEWNDANNALVGNGVSMVTLYYLRRYQVFFAKLLEKSTHTKIVFSEEVADLLTEIFAILKNNKNILNQRLNDKMRKTLLDQLGLEGSNYRKKIYGNGFSGKKKEINTSLLIDFCNLSLEYIDQTIKTNERDDKLYQAYNLMNLENEGEISVRYLYEMLEGQVSLLNSGYLATDDALELIETMRKSALYRKDQYSYMLYPNRQLPLFVEKNIIPEEDFNKSQLLKKLVEDGNRHIVLKDAKGNYHFNGTFRNAAFLRVVLENLKSMGYAELVEKDKDVLIDIYEKIFNHAAFTGRSGTFYKYEGLGCIYWHMVAKLLLVVNEIYFKAIKSVAKNETISRLYQSYYDIRAGLGVNKSPELYGSFPTDPYSHTPGHAGVQQPGMTGQVKEDIISRFGELGISVENGKILFIPYLLRKEEFLKESASFIFYDYDGKQQSIQLGRNMLAFTYCQVPVVYHNREKEQIRLTRKDGSVWEEALLEIDEQTSAGVFNRRGDIIRIDVFFKK